MRCDGSLGPGDDQGPVRGKTCGLPKTYQSLQCAIFNPAVRANVSVTSTAGATRTATRRLLYMVSKHEISAEINALIVAGGKKEIYVFVKVLGKN